LLERDVLDSGVRFAYAGRVDKHVEGSHGLVWKVCSGFDRVVGSSGGGSYQEAQLR
jgi:hypothetical protein